MHWNSGHCSIRNTLKHPVDEQLNPHVLYYFLFSISSLSFCLQFLPSTSSLGLLLFYGTDVQIMHPILLHPPPPPPPLPVQTPPQTQPPACQPPSPYLFPSLRP